MDGTRENMLPMMGVRRASMSASFVAASIVPSRQWSVLGVPNILQGGIRASTVLRGSAAREIPAERERVASVGRFCGVAQEHSLHDEELGG